MIADAKSARRIASSRRGWPVDDHEDGLLWLDPWSAVSFSRPAFRQRSSVSIGSSIMRDDELPTHAAPKDHAVETRVDSAHTLGSPIVASGSFDEHTSHGGSLDRRAALDAATTVHVSDMPCEAIGEMAVASVRRQARQLSKWLKRGRDGVRQRDEAVSVREKALDDELRKAHTWLADEEERLEAERRRFDATVARRMAIIERREADIHEHESRAARVESMAQARLDRAAELCMLAEAWAAHVTEEAPPSELERLAAAIRAEMSDLRRRQAEALAADRTELEALRRELSQQLAEICLHARRTERRSQ